MNLGEAKSKAFKLIKKYSDAGEIIDATDEAHQDYLLRMNDLADDAQKEIARFIKIPAVYSFTQWDDDNLLGINAFDMERYTPGATVEKTATGAKSYYFEVDRPCTVYIEEEILGVWTVIETISPTTITTFTAYKGNLTLTTDTDSVKIRCAGTYPYTIRNRALFANSYATDADVPDYKAFVAHVLPTDFMEFDKIMRWYDQRQYQLVTGDYRYTGKKTIELNFFLNGQFDVHYFKLPTTIDDATDDSYDFEVDDNAQNLIPYYMAAHLIMHEKQNIYVALKQEYDNKLVNLSTVQTPFQEGEITTVSGW